MESVLRYRQNLTGESRRKLGRVCEKKVDLDSRSLLFRLRDISNIKDIEEEAELREPLFFYLRKRFILRCKCIMSRVIHGFRLFVRFRFLGTWYWIQRAINDLNDSHS